MHLLWDTPFQLQLSFEEPIRAFEQLAEKGDVNAQALLEEVARFPELRTGIENVALLNEQAVLISKLLRDYFPPVLSENEIKAVSIPLTTIIFNHSERFKKILEAAGPDFEINIRGMTGHQYYVMSCCIILNEYYGTHLNFSNPLFYDIPTATGITKHYRILYNGDFLDITPTEKFVPLTEADIDQLINNFDDTALWKEKFPLDSWLMRGFSIMNLFDATIENAVSILKEKLLGINANGFRESIESIFRSIYQIPDVQIGFTAFKDGTFGPDPFGQQLSSFILQGGGGEATELMCSQSYCSVIQERHYFAVADTALSTGTLAANMLSQGIRSFILAPVAKNDVLFGVLEVVSFRPKELNSINANKLEVLMPFLTDTIERLSAELQNQVQALIQDKYTTIHSSVYWKFKAEAERFIYNKQLAQDYKLQEIVFPDVYPLYGQVDIKGSSEARNTSIQKDLKKQLKALSAILVQLNTQQLVEASYDMEQQLNKYLAELALPLQASTEQYIDNYLNRKVHPRIRQVTNESMMQVIYEYFNTDFHVYRRKYETTISMINEQLATIIDERQVEAQEAFQHYYERFKTDGVEHNLYVGAAIAPFAEFNMKKLYALRMWQLRVICEMEQAHYHLRPVLPYPLEVTTLVLVYQSHIDIRFRMDEKRFDVDGSYNARFEIVKKRIDKAHIKGSPERITQPGKLTIVYSNDVEAQEYGRYIKVLQGERLLDVDVEQFDVEDLEGVSGLKILRAKILHHS
ncbi:GAF domain-containing protein [Chitinophaga oryziterrae]|uniref:GAF domain-containing protein n=1 Tax=Chitinophaga oryziterrae TaxID=1031224 RepID=A0A6N8JCJ2_9BACT|nr:GAF domain-containing protein [Chitinophaga oryziterrae]MVT42977.1 GAF domain-containing protein [Chitinophaga oryziterrae]